MALVYSDERPVPLEFEYRETALHETVQDLLSSAQAPIYIVNFTQRGVRGARPEPHQRPGDRQGGAAKDQRGDPGLPVRHPLRSRDAPLPELRDRCPPRGSLAEVPVIGGAAGAARAVAGDLRHRHPGRRGQHSHPNRPVHEAREVRRAEDLDPEGPGLQADRRPGGVARLVRRPGLGRLPGSRAYDRPAQGGGEGEEAEEGEAGPAGRPGLVERRDLPQAHRAAA